MKLYTIVHDVYPRQTEPLFDNETGAPVVWQDDKLAKREVREINRRTDGGYRLLEFETED